MSDPKPIGSTIRREQKRLWKSCPGLGLQSLWEEASGPEISANTSVKSLRDGVMIVTCSSGGWACELRFHAGELTKKINLLAPPEEVRQIRFVHAARGGWKSRK